MNTPKDSGRILVLSPELPYPLSSGSHVRIHAFTKALQRRFSVTLFALLQGLETPSDMDAVRELCDRQILHRVSNKKSLLRKAYHRASFECLHVLKGLPAHAYYNNLSSIQRHLRSVLASEKYDAILQEYWYTSLHLHRMAPQTLRILDTHDVHFERMNLFPPSSFFCFPDRDLKKYKWMELYALSRFDMLIALSEGDRETFSRHLQNDIHVVPTGVDMNLFHPQRAVESIPGRIGFFGAISNPANLDGLFHFHQEIFPRIRALQPSVQLYIIGGHVVPEVEEMAIRDPQVRITGYVQDLRQELQKLELVVMPLRRTSGIRGRIYEIMASQVPMVAYPEATKGMSLEADRHYVEARTPEQFADKVIHLLRDPRHADGITKEAYRLMKTKYSHQATYDAFCETLEQRILQRTHANL